MSTSTKIFPALPRLASATQTDSSTTVSNDVTRRDY